MPDITVTISHRYDRGPGMPPTVVATSKDVWGKEWRTALNPNIHQRPVEQARLLATQMDRIKSPAGRNYAAHYRAIADDLEAGVLA